MNLFSSSGELEQSNRAMTAAFNGSLSVGCSSDDGCVLASYKHLPILADKKHFHKVFNVCPTIGVTYSGLQPDFRIQLEIAQKICQDYYDVLGRFPPLDVFISEFSLILQDHTQNGNLRPFGTFLIFAGMKKETVTIDSITKVVEKPACYHIDPTGSFRSATSVTSGQEYKAAKAFIERRLEKLEDNIINSVIALKEHCGSEITEEDVSVGVFSMATKEFRMYLPSEIKEIFDIIQN